MNSSCSQWRATAGPYLCELCLKFVLVLLATNIASILFRINPIPNPRTSFSQPPVPASSQPPVPASFQTPCQGPGADAGFQKEGGGVAYENWGVVHFRPIQPVCVCVGGGGGVPSALGQFNQWGGGVLST